MWFSATASKRLNGLHFDVSKHIANQRDRDAYLYEQSINQSINQTRMETSRLAAAARVRKPKQSMEQSVSQTIKQPITLSLVKSQNWRIDTSEITEIWSPANRTFNDQSIKRAINPVPSDLPQTVVDQFMFALYTRNLPVLHSINQSISQSSRALLANCLDRQLRRPFHICAQYHVNNQPNNNPANNSQSSNPTANQAKPTSQSSTQSSASQPTSQSSSQSHQPGSVNVEHAGTQSPAEEAKTELHQTNTQSINQTIWALLLTMGADPNMLTFEKNTPLHIAAKHSNFKFCAFLIFAGADANLLNVFDQYPKDMLNDPANNQSNERSNNQVIYQSVAERKLASQQRKLAKMLNLMINQHHNQSINQSISQSIKEASQFAAIWDREAVERERQKDLEKGKHLLQSINHSGSRQSTSQSPVLLSPSSYTSSQSSNQLNVEDEELILSATISQLVKQSNNPFVKQTNRPRPHTAPVLTHPVIRDQAVNQLIDQSTNQSIDRFIHQFSARGRPLTINFSIPPIKRTSRQSNIQSVKLTTRSLNQSNIQTAQRPTTADPRMVTYVNNHRPQTMDAVNQTISQSVNPSIAPSISQSPIHTHRVRTLLSRESPPSIPSIHQANNEVVDQAISRSGQPAASQPTSQPVSQPSSEKRHSHSIGSRPLTRSLLQRPLQP